MLGTMRRMQNCESPPGASMTGFDVAQRLREMEIEEAAERSGRGGARLQQHSCIVGLVHGSSEEEEARCSGAGMDYFLPKPLRLWDLQLVIRYRCQRSVWQPSESWDP